MANQEGRYKNEANVQMGEGGLEREAGQGLVVQEMAEQEDGEPGLAQWDLVSRASHRRVSQALVFLAPPTNLDRTPYSDSPLFTSLHFLGS